MGSRDNCDLAGTRILRGVAILFKYYIVEGMTVYGMLFCIGIVIMLIIVPVFKRAISGNGSMKNLGMVMMWYQVMSQEY